MLRVIIFIFFCTFSFALEAKDTPEFYKVRASSGDGIYSLLRRYHLDRYTCNFEQFYTLNKLKRNAMLLAGRDYYLPILLYNFNGQTIRSTVGIEDWSIALRIQEYNELMLSEKLRDEDFRQNKVLWVPFHELNCPVPDLVIPGPDEPAPPAAVEGGENELLENKSSRNFPIFGEKYAETPLVSNKLAGQVYYVVSGHGGPDPGAMATRNGFTLCEDEYAYDVALRLCRKLIENGATAYMINRDPDDGIRSGTELPCDYDEVLWGNIEMMPQVKPRLFQRSNVINELYEKHRKQGVPDRNQRMIIIHVDSRNKTEQIDLFFYYRAGHEESQVLALQLHDTMKKKYRKYRSDGRYHGTVSTRDLHMLRETLPTAVYIEIGNIRHSFDQKRFVLESNREYLAAWLYEGLAR